MGHMIEILDFDLKVDRKAAWAEVNDFCRMNCDPYEFGGDVPEVLASPIEWETSRSVFGDLEAASDYLYARAVRNPYVPTAVRYRSDGTPSRRTLALIERLEKLRGELRAMQEKSLPKHRKSEYIGCPGCGSKLARVLLYDRYACPLCDHDLRSQSAVKSIDAKVERMAEVCKKLRESRVADGEKAPIRWAVIAEVYC